MRSGVRMTVSSPIAKVGGRPIVFRGKVGAKGGDDPGQWQDRAAAVPLAGTALERVPLSSHRSREARFRYAYRFADDDSRGTRFQFRAFAPAQTGWPYKQASSKPVAVTGT